MFLPVSDPTRATRHQWQHRLSFFAALFLIAGFTAGLWHLVNIDTDDPNEFQTVVVGTRGASFGECVKQTQREIELRYGRTKNEWEGYRPLGGCSRKELPTGRIKTLVLSGRGGFDNAEGTVMVWLVKRQRGWVCFDSAWFSGNVLFP